MKAGKVFRALGRLAAALALLAALYVALVYALVFRPSCMRSDPTDEKNREHFVTEENFQAYQREREWFWDSRPEAVSTESFDGLKLAGYTLRADGEPRGTVLLMHGYHSEPVREFAALLRFYHDSGYNIVLPFQRTHGASGGEFVTFGVRERFDVLKWAAKAAELYGADSPLFLHGISMGCATVLMSLELDLPENVRGVVADCGFTTPRAIIWKVLDGDWHVPTAAIVIRLCDFFARNLAGFSLDEASTLTAIEANKRRLRQIPVLFFHGTKDDFVPIDMTGENFMVAEGSFVNVSGAGAEFVPNPQAERYEFVQIADAPHAISALVDGEKYRAELSAFLGKYGR